MELRATALWMSRLDGGTDRQFAAILERAIAGDVSAFEQIIVRYERRVLMLAWRLLGKSEDAQDASQEVFLRAFRFLHRFDMRRPFEPWLLKMTVNVCHDVGRKRLQHPNALIDPDALRSAGDPHTELHSVEQKKMLYDALQELPERTRIGSDQVFGHAGSKLDHDDASPVCAYCLNGEYIRGCVESHREHTGICSLRTP